MGRKESNQSKKCGIAFDKWGVQIATILLHQLLAALGCDIGVKMSIRPSIFGHPSINNIHKSVFFCRNDSCEMSNLAH